MTSPARLLVAATALGGCTYHEPEPLAKTLPVATVLAAATATGLWWIVRWSIRRGRAARAGAPPVARVPRTTTALLWAPVVPLAAVAALLVREVAVGYRYARYDIFSWGDTAILAALVAAVTLLAAGVAGALGARLLSADPAVHRRGVVGLALLAGLGLLAWGLGLVWLPALVAALFRRRAPGVRPQGSVGAITSKPSPAAAGIWWRSKVR